MKQLLEQINIVVEAREKAQRLQLVKDKYYAEWKEKFAGALEEVAAANQWVSETETLLRQLTLQAYAKTGNKAPAVGVGIREVTKLEYDGKVAFDWAKAHKMALKLDTKAFEKIVKADTPDFVKITTEPQATIATKLEVK